MVPQCRLALASAHEQSLGVPSTPQIEVHVGYEFVLLFWLYSDYTYWYD
jgi:hypothetical protein